MNFVISEELHLFLFQGEEHSVIGIEMVAMHEANFLIVVGHGDFQIEVLGADLH